MVKNYKYWFQAFALLSVLLFSFMGCVTKELWRNDSIVEHYNEKIISFYANKSSGKLIFIGEKYHYIFSKNSEEFIELLSKKEFLKLKQEDLAVETSVSLDKDNRVISHIDVSFDTSLLNRQQLEYLTAQNFRYRGGEKYQNTYTLIGKRYKSKEAVNNRVLKLSHPLSLKIETSRKEKDITLYKVLMTPLAMTADAGLGLAGVVYLPVLLYRITTMKRWM